MEDDEQEYPRMVFEIQYELAHVSVVASTEEVEIDGATAMTVVAEDEYDEEEEDAGGNDLPAGL